MFIKIFHVFFLFGDGRGKEKKQSPLPPPHPHTHPAPTPHMHTLAHTRPRPQQGAPPPSPRQLSCRGEKGCVWGVCVGECVCVCRWVRGRVSWGYRGVSEGGKVVYTIECKSVRVAGINHYCRRKKKLARCY